ncbi:ATP-binding cassette domain-containing protein [Paenibacillus sp. SC116]|uniref:ATP-binding cassette domain-containing protein n=1 Tax=Paenibacillus sp. SC116 TaxID=2968986 RepID=UPI00215A63DC|nr:ATP-binding cassette domain-containing protein [Paenibacillus sp. SC116]MCR8844633.1 ATP-binding cassette domain-containing protein [Paenibacillus sp. SC116]
MSTGVFGSSLSASQVWKQFDHVTVLEELSLQVKPGEFIAIVGKSGCGKSTLLRLVAGLEEPTDGTLLLDGKPIQGIDPDTRVLFQDARLLPWKKVIDNVRIGVRGGHTDDALAALQMVGLEDKAQVWPSTLSGGQRQRVALARALAGNPRLLLLDEPLGALDALTRIDMQDLIEKLWQRQRFSVILVTHDVSEAVALADRVVLMKDGAIALDVAITLPRPRERDSGFAYFEQLILDRVMERDTPSERAARRQTSYSI